MCYCLMAKNFYWSGCEKILDIGNGDSIVGGSYWTMNVWLGEKYCLCVINKALFKN